MSRTCTAVRPPLRAALLLVAALAVAGCNRPADEVEPTPVPLELELPERLGPPLIEPATLPPTDPSIATPPDPREQPLPPSMDPPELPATDPVPTEATSDPVG